MVLFGLINIADGNVQTVVTSSLGTAYFSTFVNCEVGV